MKPTVKNGRSLDTPTTTETNSKQAWTSRTTGLSLVIERKPRAIVGPWVRTTLTRFTPRCSPQFARSHPRSVTRVVPRDRQHHVVRRGPRMCPRSKHIPTPTWSACRSSKTTSATPDLLPLHPLHHRVFFQPLRSLTSWGSPRPTMSRE